MPDRTAVASAKRVSGAGLGDGPTHPIAVPGAQAVREQNDRFTVAFENMSHGICMFDAGERMVFCNGHYIRMFGLDSGFMKPGITLWQILEHSVARSIASVSADELYAERKAFIQRREAANYSEMLADGRIIAISHRPLADGGWVSIYEDITERRNSEMTLQEQYRRFEAALANMSQGLLMFDQETRLVVRNARYLQMFGVSSEEQPLGVTRRDLLGMLIARGTYVEFDMEREVEVLRRAIEAGRTLSVLRELSDGRTISVSHRPMEGGWVETFEDVTESRRAEASIRHMAHHDPLTDLANRAQFSEKLEYVLALSSESGKPSAVFSLDLDRFKAVNDTLGHAVGDEVIKQASARLWGTTRETDVLARLGGDEFALLMRPIDGPEAAARVADRIIKSIGTPMTINGQQVEIGASVGIAVGPGDGVKTDTLVKNADLALYKAKSEGRSTYHFFETGMDADLQSRRSIEAGLRLALQREELRLMYQPLLGLKENRVTCVEALLRWDHDGRTISPTEFIPIAEETGIIVAIGEWVLREACKMAVTWPGDVRVAVNLSPVQFKSRDLLGLVKSALADARLPATRLELEITESLLLAENDANLKVLHDLRAMGVRISMDDFGTGYSSLSYLRSFPFDKIKIDRSFMRDLTSRGDSQAIIKAVIGLGQSLGMSTTAEGVETEEQLEMVRAQGASEVQGFLFSPPLAPAALASLLHSEAVKNQPERKKAS